MIAPRAKGNRWRRMPRWRKALVVLCAVLLALALLALCALDARLITRTYALHSGKLANEAPIRIVVLADLHSYAHGGDQQPLLKRIERLRPDLICLVGDIADDHSPIYGTELLLAGIRDMAPCLYVTGNHEHWGDIDAILSTFAAYDIPVLRNEAVEMEINGQRLYIYGVDDPYYTAASAYAQFFTGMPPLPQDAYTILLSHRPDPMLVYAGYGFDLVLSGHTHGGQVRIPLLVNGLYTPDEGWFPKYAGGRYDEDGTTMIISRGLSHYPNLPRVFNRPEVVLVTLSP